MGGAQCPGACEDRHIECRNGELLWHSRSHAVKDGVQTRVAKRPEAPTANI